MTEKKHADLGQLQNLVRRAVVRQDELYIDLLQTEPKSPEADKILERIRQAEHIEKRGRELVRAHPDHSYDGL